MLFNAEQKDWEDRRSAHGYWWSLKQQLKLLMWRSVDGDNIKVARQPAVNTAAELEGSAPTEGISSPAPL